MVSCHWLASFYFSLRNSSQHFCRVDLVVINFFSFGYWASLSPSLLKCNSGWKFLSFETLNVILGFCHWEIGGQPNGASFVSYTPPAIFWIDFWWFPCIMSGRCFHIEILRWSIWALWLWMFKSFPPGLGNFQLFFKLNFLPPSPFGLLHHLRICIL